MAIFAAGKKAIAICDRCGFQYKLNTLKKEIVKGRQNDLKVCKSCFDPDHPQLHLGEYPVYDPQALKDPRPDPALETSRELTVPGDVSVEQYILEQTS